MGCSNLWSPTRHGRGSGIGFVVPWDAINAALPGLKQGKSVRHGYMGIGWDPKEKRPTLSLVAEKSPAEEAGLMAGDVIVTMAGQPVSTVTQCTKLLTHLWAGDPLAMTIARGPKTYDIDLVLGTRP